MAVADGGQRLHTEEKAVEKPMCACARDAVWAETVERSEGKIESDVKRADERGELRPTQTEQPTVNVAPSPRVCPDFDELDLARPN